MDTLDKKRIEKLKALRDLDAISDSHRRLVGDMLDKYTEPDWHFFTSAQRRLIDNIHAIYLEPPSHKDMALLKEMDQYLEDPDCDDYEQEKILRILAQHGRIPKMFAPWDLEFIKGLKKSTAERRSQAKVCAALEAALEEGLVRSGSEDFCRSIISQFNERRHWSSVQMYHAEKILAGNRDAGDDETQ